MSNKVYQIHVTLKYSKPKIWRRILVDSETLLVDLHRILQTTLGWTNSHLHAFTGDMGEYAPAEFELDYAKDSRKTKLNKILKEEKASINYEYDFGDGWIHPIILEKILPADDQTQIPICIAGKGACPPEDVGGIWGYAEILEILKDPKHKEHESYKEWLGEDFDPEDFDMETVNELLQEDDFGCIWLE